MKIFLSLLLICFSLSALAQEVGEVSVSSTRMRPETLKKLFLLKPGDTFSPEIYEKAQDDLHRLRVFKKLDFTATPQGDKVDIAVKAQDGSYIFPLAFAAGGAKSAAGVSLAGGNLFKQGESTFLFGGGSQDGITASAGITQGDEHLSVSYTKLNFDQRFYSGYRSNMFGVFSTTDDEDEYTSDLKAQVHSKKEQFSVTYSHRFSRTVRAFIRPEYVRYAYSSPGFDNGNHNQITLGLHLTEDIRQGTNMGALSGYGLTDKEKSLRNLPHPRQGYATGIYYTGGGNWTGSDYTLAKLGLNAAWVLELKNRHMFIVQGKAQHAFKASFSDEILSADLLTFGRYDRQIRGERGAGIGTSFVYYLLRNRTGLLSLAPFYENAYVYAGGKYRAHSGAGATLSYKLWRFPLPLGINYTHNLQDSGDLVGFVIGGAF